MKKRRLKKKAIVLAGLVLAGIILIIVAIFTVKYRLSNEYKLKQIGYNKEEVKNIIIENRHIKDILKMDYQKNVVDILRAKYYLDKNFQTYLDYSNQNQDKSINDVIAIINVHANNDWYTNTSMTDIDKGNTMLVNKFHQLPEDFNPVDIVAIKNWYAYEGHSIKEEVYDQFVKMYNDAKKIDLSLIISSSYRTSQNQEDTYESIKASNGVSYADSYAARKGYSEHQTGLALDIVKHGTYGNEFEDTDEYAWLIDNAHKYGFILRYPKGKEYLTGYAYESWHYRYLGVELATKVYNENITYDEYYAYYIEGDN